MAKLWTVWESAGAVSTSVEGDFVGTKIGVVTESLTEKAIWHMLDLAILGKKDCHSFLYNFN